MKKVSKIAAILFLSTITLTAWAGHGDGCLKKGDASAKQFSQLLDNHSMRLWTIELKPGEFASVHAFPGHKAYAATAGTLQITTSEGKVEEIKVRAGDLLWTEVTKYKTVNVGSEAFKAVVYEDKSEGKSLSQNFFSLISKN